jgi:SRSO17 transposase
VEGLAPAELARSVDAWKLRRRRLRVPAAHRSARPRACYLRGLMLDGRRKSIEPMAARLGEVHYQALHHFVATSPWDWRPVRRRLAERLVAALAPRRRWWTTPASRRTARARWGCNASTFVRRCL